MFFGESSGGEGLTGGSCGGGGGLGKLRCGK